MFWIDEPRSADELSMLQEWALDHAAPDRHVAIGALSAQKHPALAETWRTLLKEPAMVKADLFTISQGLLSNGSEADVPVVLGVLKSSGDAHLTRIATEAPPNISAAALHELILADARKQAAEQWEAIRRAERDGPGLADTVVARVITASQKSLTACAEAAPTESPATRVTLQLTIGTSGAVTRATVDPDAYRGTPLERCLLKIGTGLVFPRADEETEVQVPLRVGRATAP